MTSAGHWMPDLTITSRSRWQRQRYRNYLNRARCHRTIEFAATLPGGEHAPAAPSRLSHEIEEPVDARGNENAQQAERLASRLVSWRTHWLDGIAQPSSKKPESSTVSTTFKAGMSGGSSPGALSLRVLAIGELSPTFTIAQSPSRGKTM